MLCGHVHRSRAAFKQHTTCLAGCPKNRPMPDALMLWCTGLPWAAGQLWARSAPQTQPECQRCSAGAPATLQGRAFSLKEPGPRAAIPPCSHIPYKLLFPTAICCICSLNSRTAVITTPEAPLKPTAGGTGAALEIHGPSVGASAGIHPSHSAHTTWALPLTSGDGAPPGAPLDTADHKEMPMENQYLR